MCLRWAYIDRSLVLFNVAGYFSDWALGAVHSLDTKGGGLGVGLTWKFVDAFFAAQDSFNNGPTANQTATEVKERMTSLAIKATGVSKAPFDEAFTYHSQAESATRVSWKYGCARGVFGTPTFLVNGVPVPAAGPAWTLANWTALLDPLLDA